MFRKMRRDKQALTPDECIDILRRATAGVLAVSGDGGYPYAVPMSYVYHDNKIYFHCAQTGHKLDAIAQNDKVSFCVVDKDQIVPDEYTTYFRSVIVFGRARVLRDEADKRAALELLAARYAPHHDAARRAQVVDSGYAFADMVELAIEHMSGKEAAELTRARQAQSH
ncbi:MAG: pyridoxamine 5'-phosphate oxidase family protein [Eubacteriales bacterium]|nr:pyridoxamine 5'-phosphate oxidase family protein [Eubacteriales bacterium]